MGGDVVDEAPGAAVSTSATESLVGRVEPGAILRERLVQTGWTLRSTVCGTR